MPSQVETPKKTLDPLERLWYVGSSKGDYMTTREVLDNLKKSGTIKGCSFQKRLTNDYYLIVRQDGKRIKARPMIGNNQSELLMKDVDTKEVYCFKKNA